MVYIRSVQKINSKYKCTETSLIITCKLNFNFGQSILGFPHVPDSRVRFLKLGSGNPRNRDLYLELGSGNPKTRYGFKRKI